MDNTLKLAAIPHMYILLPLFVMALKIVMKNVVNRVVDSPCILNMIIDAPVDIIFISISFIASRLIISDEDGRFAVLVIIFYVTLSLLTVTIWRTLSPASLRESIFVRLIFVFKLSITYLISVVSLVFSMSLLQPGT